MKFVYGLIALMLCAGLVFALPPVLTSPKGCIGTASACNLMDELMCNQQQGCDWIGGTCTGSPKPCSDFSTNRTACLNQAICQWGIIYDTLCSPITISWSGPSTVYIYAKNPLSTTFVYDLKATGYSLVLPWDYIETALLADGNYNLWVCDNMGHKDDWGGTHCSNQALIVKNVTPKLIWPKGQAVVPNSYFTWSKINGANSYSLKFGGDTTVGFFDYWNVNKALYVKLDGVIPDGVNNRKFALLSDWYNALYDGEIYNWGIAASCAANPTTYWKKIQWSVPAQFSKG